MSNEKIRLVVLNEHTLGYQNDGERRIFVFHASVAKGANYTTRNGDMVYPNPGDTLRLASEADFNEYMISFDGYLTDLRYIYDGDAVVAPV